MPTKILFKRNDIPTIEPTINEINLGEIAINTHDGKLFTKINQNGNESIVEIGGGGSGGTASELEKITEDSQTGWALLHDNRQNKINIGYHAIDFSYGVADSSLAGGIYGAGGNYSFAEGKGTLASGYVSHAEGYHSTANAYASHAEGYRTRATAWGAHAEGYFSEASGYFSHAEGVGCVASGQASHAEGFSEASGDNAHSEGKSTASGDLSHSEGSDTSASGDFSHSEGYGTVAQNTAMHAAGRYNTGTATDTIHETGIGANHSNRKNAFEIYTDGKLVAPELDPNKVMQNSQCLVPLSYLFSPEFGYHLPTSAGATGELYKDSNGFVRVSP